MFNGHFSRHSQSWILLLIIRWGLKHAFKRLAVAHVSQIFSYEALDICKLGCALDFAKLLVSL